MSIKTPKIDDRKAKQIYEQTIALAKGYCPEWASENWASDFFNSTDLGLVVFKLFARMIDLLTTQLNQIPDKHRLAFLDFMGIDLLPASPARVPLTFYPVKGSSTTHVPSGTRVASAEPPEQIFTTIQDLSVLSVGFGAVFSLNPWDDSNINHSSTISGTEEGFSLFGMNKEKKQNSHILYLRDDMLFDIKRKPSKLTINFEGNYLSKDYFCHIPSLTPSNELNNQIELSLEIQKIQRSSVDNEEGFWLAVKPLGNIKIVKKTGLRLPVISSSSITGSITVGGILPEKAFFNNIPIDVKKGFHPLGETPKVGDSLYIGSEEAFSKAGSKITLDIKFEKKLQNIQVSLLWEYWNGKEWSQDFEDFQDNTAHFTAESGMVSFSCPLITPTKINGQVSRWIRVIIQSGGYGEAERIETRSLDDIVKLLPASLDEYRNTIKNELEKKGISFGFEYQKSTVTPPFITSLNISYSYTQRRITNFKTYNNFKYKGFEDHESDFEPYEALDGLPALYLGFEKNIANAPITLFFAVKERLYHEKAEVIKDPDCQGDLTLGNKANAFAWKYYNGNEWMDLAVEDETDSFNTGGIVSFMGPADIRNCVEFERDLYWIKTEIRDGKGKWASSPRLKGIFPNTTWAIQSVIVKDEILGTGNGKPDLTLSFSKKPVLEGQIIEVKEVCIPTENELEAIKTEEGEDAVRVMKDESGEIQEVWVRWHEVRSFALSGPLARHYVLDRSNGRVIFGDGQKGMIPSKGKNNILARYYTSGGGKKGNLEVGSISVLKTTIPNIERVINHIPSSAGREQEDLNSVIHRGPYSIKNRNRAVTKEDFEQLAFEVSQDIVRTKCLMSKNGNIEIIVVPESSVDAPLPESGLLDAIERYLKEKALLTIRNRIEVVGPDYKRIDVKVAVKTISPAEGTIVSDKIKKRLKTFFHPLLGGQYGKGWDFGEDIFISEVAAIVAGIEGVDFIKEIELTKKMEALLEEVAPGPEKKSWISIEENALPCPGIICVEVE